MGIHVLALGSSNIEKTCSIFRSQKVPQLTVPLVRYVFYN